MDVDRFMADNRLGWERLAELTNRARRLSGPEVRELTRLYQRASGQLAYAQAHFVDRDVKAALTLQVAQTASVLYGTRPSFWRLVGRFFFVSFPLAVWQLRWFVLASALALFVPAVVLGVWIAHSHAAVNLVAPAAVRATYVNHDFASYYRSQASAQFATEVYTNNVKVAFYAFAGGIAFGTVTLYMLALNGANLGVAAGLFYSAHHPGEFWGLVTPHGLLELSSVVLAGAAGLRLGWTLVDPGDRPRIAALAAEGNRAVVLVFGTVFTLAVSGLIEGFVTGSALPTVARVGIGVTVEVTFLSWVILASRAARASGAAITAEDERFVRGAMSRGFAYSLPEALAPR